LELFKYLTTSCGLSWFFGKVTPK